MAKRVSDITSDEVIDEKKVLKEAEEREKERKEEEAEAKVLAKEEAVEKAKEDRAKRVEEKKLPQQRRKPRHGKKYREIAKLIEKDTEYPLDQAIELALKTSPTKFDATVEVHIKINQKEKNIRGTVTLPGGVAKEKRVLGVTEKNLDELIANVKTGKIEFDVLVAAASVMPKLAQVAKILGPKGLMPSPKAGTVVDDVDATVLELKGGRVEYRADKLNIVHLPIGKISFGADKIKQNYEALLSHLPKKIDSIHLTTTMGPSVKVVKK